MLPIILALILFVSIVILGTAILMGIVERKWGYTPEREQELEEAELGKVDNGKGRI